MSVVASAISSACTGARSGVVPCRIDLAHACFGFGRVVTQTAARSRAPPSRETAAAAVPDPAAVPPAIPPSSIPGRKPQCGRARLWPCESMRSSSLTSHCSTASDCASRQCDRTFASAHAQVGVGGKHLELRADIAQRAEARDDLDYPGLRPGCPDRSGHRAARCDCAAADINSVEPAMRSEVSESQPQRRAAGGIGAQPRSGR